MVQVLRPSERPKSPSEAFLEGMGAGIGPAVGKFFDQREQKQQAAKRNEALKNLTGMDLSGMPPEMQQAYALELLKQGGASKQQSADLEKAMQIQRLKQDADTDKRKQQQELVSGMFNSQGNAPTQQRNGLGQEQADVQGQPDIKSTTPNEQSPASWSDEAIARLTVENPALGREARAAKDSALKERREVTTAKEKKQAELRAETFPLKKEITDKAQSARVGIENKEHLLDLIEKGDLNDPTIAALAEALPLNLGKRILSPDTVEYKSGLIDEYKDLRQIFQGQTRIKEIELLEAKTADIYLTDAQKKAILNSRINALKADIAREEAAIELDQEGKDYGILQYRREIEKRAKPKLEALFHRILDEQQAIIKDAENIKKAPLNYDDPESRMVLEQIMKEAGGDRNKARAIAKKKGYTVGS